MSAGDTTPDDRLRRKPASRAGNYRRMSTVETLFPLYVLKKMIVSGNVSGSGISPHVDEDIVWLRASNSS